VPEISRFFGIIISMNYREHEPAHFHAWYSGFDVTVDIGDGKVRGSMPHRAVSLVLEWWHLHREELQQNWTLAQQRQQLKRIEPLE
jgi:uncharacterized protein DUF4160